MADKPRIEVAVEDHPGASDAVADAAASEAARTRAAKEDSARERAAEVAKEDGYDELDRKIDRMLERAGTIFKALVVVALIGAFIAFVIAPRWDVLGPPIIFATVMVSQLIFAMFYIVIQFVVLFWFIGRPRIYWVMPGETGVGFKDYKGNPEVLESANQVVTLLRGVKRFKQMGGQPIRGLLLEGPPGTGKSYLGQAISTEAGVPFGYLSAPSIQGMFMGMDALRVMSLYNKARKLARKYGACILFIDEIDAIGKSRSGQGPGMGMGMMMMGGGTAGLNELLNQMDPLPRDSIKDKVLRWFGLRSGRAEQPPVLTVAATNLVAVLDPALLRPGRFDRQLRVGAPSFEGRREVLEYYLSKVKHVDLPLEQMVAETVNYTPVQIKHLVNEAVVHAVWNEREAIDYDDFRWAMETYEWGMRVPVVGMTYEDKRRLSYHEAGHAVAMVKLLTRHRVTRATIEARHDIGAAALVGKKPNEEIHTYTKSDMVASMQISLASRAAELMFLGEEMTGASGDLANATSIAEQMVKMWGMNGSLVSAGGLMGGGPMGGGAVVGSTRDVERILDQNFRKARALLEENRAAVVAVAEALIEKHAITGDEVYALVEAAEAQSQKLNKLVGKVVTAAAGEANGSNGAHEGPNGANGANGVHVAAAPAVAVVLGDGSIGSETEEEDATPPADAPAFQVEAGGEQRADPPGSL